MKKYVSVIIALHLVSMNLFAWTNGELLVWIDSDRGYALASAAKKCEDEFGIKVIESPEKEQTAFQLRPKLGEVPDIVIWAHDKVGEWADGGLIAPLELSKEFLNRFCPKASQAVLPDDWIRGYPIALGTETLIYNRKLPPPPRTHGDAATAQ